jgi:hypothetical protein
MQVSLRFLLKLCNQLVIQLFYLQNNTKSLFAKLAGNVGVRPWASFLRFNPLSDCRYVMTRHVTQSSYCRYVMTRHVTKSSYCRYVMTRHVTQSSYCQYVMTRHVTQSSYCQYVVTRHVTQSSYVSMSFRTDEIVTGQANRRMHNPQLDTKPEIQTAFLGAPEMGRPMQPHNLQQP